MMTRPPPAALQTRSPLLSPPPFSVPPYSKGAAGAVAKCARPPPCSSARYDGRLTP